MAGEMDTEGKAQDMRQKIRSFLTQSLSRRARDSFLSLRFNNPFDEAVLTITVPGPLSFKETFGSLIPSKP